MKGSGKQRIFARIDADEFVGRAAELERLLTYARNGGSSGIVVLAAPRVGASELLRRSYDMLFDDERSVVPFYFELKESDRAARNAAFRFAHEFLVQTVAFKRRDPTMIAIAADLNEIAEIAPPSDGHWIDRLVHAIGKEPLSGDRSYIRTCLSAPLRAVAGGTRSFVMIDDVHVAPRLEGGTDLLEELFEVLSSSLLSTVLSGRRRFLFGKKQAEIVDLGALPFADAGRLVESRAARMGVAVNDQTRDLIAAQLGGRPGHIVALLGSAAANSDELRSFDDVERAYTDEIFGGHLGSYFDSVLAGTGKNGQIVDLLAETLTAGSVPLNYWKKHTGLPDAEFSSAMTRLHDEEIVSVSSGSVTIDRTDVVLCDHIRARSRLSGGRVPRALAIGETLAENIRRAPALMARLYRQNAAIGLLDLMQAFDGRQVSPVLLDYARFKQELKGASDDKVQKALKDDNDRMRLPHIVYTAHTGDLYPPLNELCDIERSAVGIGFTSALKKDETAWLAAEVESKLEASPDVVEFWCDRLEMAAAHSGFSEFTIWLIAPEGFSPEALEVLRSRDAYGSSRRQVELLAKMLNADIAPQAATAGEEYEFVVPMGAEAEMLTAHSIDEMGRRHDLPGKALNQIKTAVVEACINAGEHGLSPDRKIYQKFLVAEDKVTITVTNRGVRLVDKPNVSQAEEVRRGWGLKLIRGLMDAVEIEETDDGTRITMVKNIRSDS
jgi:serine/threonine-protein kinase RsbW